MLVQDLFLETIALQRIALFTRLIANSKCTGGEKDIALAWLSELTSDLENKLDEYEGKSPQKGGLSGGRSRFQ
ncbi:hypothetical protein C5363_15610 [Salmonella enterica subsp. enterica serovar Newport]|nr:hypothetical protein [Salmonella enterica]EEA9261543.1 hypothetical protein [Salmonella enterica subsp. enterica serovar Newport]EAO5469132.1 hypothetical protein [Salmonella enterica]EAP6581910.1 hypothetical protein [Salmonella enterica]EAT2046473.1 hypothetical protein [Salmonella enterica]